MLARRVPTTGLSPRVRGNPCLTTVFTPCMRSIPACAGEPLTGLFGLFLTKVYPRVCGGTQLMLRRRFSLMGLSPRVRGNPIVRVRLQRRVRSIPACAGEPAWTRGAWRRSVVYPRVCGGTPGQCGALRGHGGLSPRVRGNRVRLQSPVGSNRSIPACAGEPLRHCDPLDVYVKDLWVRWLAGHAANQAPDILCIGQRSMVRRGRHDGFDLARRHKRSAKSAPLLISEHCAGPGATNLGQSCYPTRVVQSILIKCGVVRYCYSFSHYFNDGWVDLLKWRGVAECVGVEAMYPRCRGFGRCTGADQGVKECITVSTDNRHLHDLGIRAETGRFNVNHYPVVTLHQVMGPSLRRRRFAGARASLH